MTAAQDVRPRRASTLRRVLTILAWVALVLLGIGVVGFIAIWIWLGQTFKAPQAVVAPVAWVTRDVTLWGDRPVVHGRLTLTSTTAPATGVRLGINAGAPSSATGASPGAILAGPVVRISDGSGTGTDTCLAPCELPVAPAFACSGGRCSMVHELSVELIGATGGGSGSTAPVTLMVAAGLTGPLEGSLPAGLRVDLVLEAAEAAEPSQPGGS